MLAQVTSGAVLGVDAYLVHVEVDRSSGLPGMSVVGLPQSAVREGRERVTAALKNSGFEVPPSRITVNLAPADIRKEGSAFDLPIALGLLACNGEFEAGRLADACFVGELGLDGELRPVRGALPLALRCRKERVGALFVPAANAREAAVVEDLRVHAASGLRQIVRQLRGEGECPRASPETDPAPTSAPEAPGPDFAEVRGQAHAKRALEVAAAGSHNVLMVGPPGSGKSMLARRLGTVLPPLAREEALELTKIHSVAGSLRPGQSLVTARPFRAPHHSVSDAGLIGGGSIPRPGEASLAHHGVLFLDELPEFRRSVLEAMRQPLEDGVIHLGRARIAVTYPARFMLVGAMNPCPCGFWGDGRGRCACRPFQVRRYFGRISGPLLDRIDVHVEVPALRADEMAERRPGESSTRIRERVVRARARQRERFRDRRGVHANAHMRPREVRAFCGLDDAGEALLRAAIRRLGLSGRAYHRILKLARTVADLEGEDAIAAAHVAEGIQYRTLDRRGRRSATEAVS